MFEGGTCMGLVVGLTGSFGSGCSTIAHKYFEPEGYRYVSLSDCLRQYLRAKGISDAGVTRHDMQTFGNGVREEKGSAFLAEQVIEQITGEPAQEKWVVDSIRNPHEVLAFRRALPGFFLCSVVADVEVRWSRVQQFYKKNRQVFDEDDSRDADENLEHGQRVRECCSLADIVISNEVDYVYGNLDQVAHGKEIERYISMMEGRVAFRPTPEETYMAVAYAISRRSSCLKRKVGAVIVSPQGSIIGSGCNEVPRELRTCVELVGGCYRDKVFQHFSEGVTPLVSDDFQRRQVLQFTDETFKNLDYCRALHAEENAILSVVGCGGFVSLAGSTLYTTTYPCNLCANKIAQVGITTVCYLEPYPMKEAREVLVGRKVEQKSFDGVTSRGYFRLNGGPRA